MKNPSKKRFILSLVASTSREDMKGFFKERKKSARGISKKSSSSTSKKSKKLISPDPDQSASVGSGISQPPALVSYGGSLDLCDDYDANEDSLRQFDMNHVYGPCIGMARLAYWERGYSHGLSHPEDIKGVFSSLFFFLTIFLHFISH